MARGRGDPDEDLDEDLADVLPPRHPSRSPGSRRGARSGDRRDPVQPWESGAEDDDDGLDLEEGRGRRRREKPPVFWRARDSLYFEPLVALAILAVLLVSLFAYTSNWPPVYVVESNSMQHGPGDHLGALNAGDVVLAQKLSQSSIVTFVRAVSTGYSTYDGPGDVILYYPNGNVHATPVIHRAILFLQYDSAHSTFSAIGLSPSECANGTGLYSVNGPQGPCSVSGLTTADVLVLYHVIGRTIGINFGNLAQLGTHSGYLTLGDNNSRPDQAPGAFHLSTLVAPAWVLGAARGMIPWFGALKLLLDGNSAYVPKASWEFLGLTIAGIIFAALGVHVLLRRESGRRHRRELDDEEEEEPLRARSRERKRAEPELGRPTPPRAGSSLRPWAGATAPRPSADDEPSARPHRASHEQRRRSHFVTPHERPPSRRRRTDRDDADPDDDLDA